MSKFKVGDKVCCVDDSGYHNTDYLVKGSIYTIVDAYWFECKSGEVSIRDTTAYPEDFKLYKEEPMNQSDMKTQPWFIRVTNEQEFNLVQEWLKKNFGKVYENSFVGEPMFLTNISALRGMCHDVFWSSDMDYTQSLRLVPNEIKVNFKTTIDSVVFPTVESEKDKKIRELKETIEAAAKQIKELEEM